MMKHYSVCFHAGNACMQGHNNVCDPFKFTKKDDPSTSFKTCKPIENKD